MHRRQRVTQKLVIGLLVPIISLCVTFLLLYFLMPRLVVPSAAVEKQPADIADNQSVSPPVAATPVRMTIDTASVSAPIKPVGLTTAGDMDIDDNPMELAWYRHGPKPGETGSAVIAGHYGWKNSAPSVFNNLNKLAKGDEVLVYDQDGIKKKFLVTRTELYDPNQDATEVFRSDDGKAHLNLITCQGAWVNAEQTYEKRLVVFTDYVESF